MGKMMNTSDGGDSIKIANGKSLLFRIKLM
jgi:hypothetical protein